MSSISPEEMRAIDENCEFLGVSRLQLMESAGKGVADAILQRMDVKKKRIVILCSSGNKGGDGFVIARHLVTRGANPEVYLLSKPELISSFEAKLNFDAITKMSSTVKIVHVNNSSDLASMEHSIISADIIIDAMLGTGASGPLREPVKTAVKISNRSSAFKVAVDIPTGIDPLSGEISGDAFKANLTVTHHKPKTGLGAPHAMKFIGELVISSIGIPPESEIYCGPGDLRIALRRRDPFSHKGQNGRLLVIGGSARYSGAPSLAALAALSVGIDLVTLAVPRSIIHEVRAYSPDLIAIPLPSEEKLDSRSLDLLESELKNCDGVVIGMGLGLDDETRVAALALIDRASILGLPIVIDADALKALGSIRDRINLPNGILTPHANEFYALTGERLPADREDGWKERLNIVMGWANKFNTTVLLKSRHDIITDGKRYKIKTIGNAGMTVGGTGDVLAGIAGAIVCRGAPPFRAAVAASFLNSRAGDLLAGEVGMSFTARQLIDYIPAVIRALES